MNLSKSESDRQKVLEAFSYNITQRQKLFILGYFLDGAFCNDNSLLSESYIIEFFNEFSNSLSVFDPFYIHPSQTRKIFNLAHRILEFDLPEDQKGKLAILIHRADEKFEKLTTLLQGNSNISYKVPKLYFPVLEVFNYNEKKYQLGLIESVTIRISKNTQEDKLIVVPLSGTMEPRIAEQINTSLQLALNYVQKHVRKLNAYHEVLIQFDNRIGTYVGYSFGMSLTIGFIEQLFKFYNLPYLVWMQNNIATSGGVDKNGHVIGVSKELIEQKLEAVFFSDISIFIVAESDEKFAVSKLKSLLSEFPERNLRVVAIGCIDDLLNRRDLVEIKKQNPIKRAGRNLVHHKLTYVFIFFLAILLGIQYLREIDDNPVYYKVEGNSLYIQNKGGKVLWSRRIGMDPRFASDEVYLRSQIRLNDLNRDGYNEVILAGEDFNFMSNPKEEGRIVCLDHKGNEVWKFNFCDTVYFSGEMMPPFYTSRIIDLVEVEGNKHLLISSSNCDSFASSLVKLDAASGKRIGKVLWHAGHIVGGYVRYIKGKQSVLVGACNNSYERNSLFAVDFDKIEGVCPASKSYQLDKIPVADLLFYILFPNTDYVKYLNYRNSSIWGCSLRCNEKLDCYSLQTYEGEYITGGVLYKLSKRDLKSFDLVIGSTFRVLRDSLVARGKLSPPFTDTREYCDLLKSKILYWNGKKFEINKDYKLSKKYSGVMYDKHFPDI